MKKTSAVSAALCLILCVGAANVKIEPSNLTVQEDQYATFTCNVPCTHSAYWYVGDYHHSSSLPYYDSVPGITYTRNNELCPSIESTQTVSHNISILATADMDRIAVQCSVSWISCEPDDSACSNPEYSRFATLRVEMLPRPQPTSLSPSSTSTSSSSLPLLSSECPTPSTVVEVRTSTKTDTITRTINRTLVVTETIFPVPSDPTGADTSASQTHLLRRIGVSSAALVTLTIVLLTLLVRL